MKQVNNTAKKATIIKVDECLDKYFKTDLFREKIASANHILKTVGLPRFKQ